MQGRLPDVMARRLMAAGLIAAWALAVMAAAAADMAVSPAPHLAGAALQMCGGLALLIFQATSGVGKISLHHQCHACPNSVPHCCQPLLPPFTCPWQTFAADLQPVSSRLTNVGSGSFQMALLNDGKDTFVYNLTLSAVNQVTRAHIHYGKPREKGPAVAVLQPQGATTVSAA